MEMMVDGFCYGLAGPDEETWPEKHVEGLEGEPVPFHLGQEWAWEAEERYLAMVCGTQSGKTVFGPWWLWREIQRCGPGDYLAITATFRLFGFKMLPTIMRVFRDILGVGRWWAGDRVLEIRQSPNHPWVAKKATDTEHMWARLLLLNADAKGGLEAGTVKAAWCDEAGQDRFSLKAWKGIQRRLALHRGRVLITTTLYNLGWVKQRMIDAVERAPDKEACHVEIPRGPIVAEADRMVSDGEDICLIQYDSILNPVYPVEEYLEAKRKTPDDEFAMFWRGRAAKLRTLIYNFFDVDENVVESFQPPSHWPRIVGVDPKGAYVAAVWLAYDRDRRQLHLYREYKEPFGPATHEHARNMLVASRGERIGAWCVGQPAERQERVDFQAAGIPAKEPPFSDLWTGIRRTNALFKEMGLVVHDSCEGIIDELGSYQRKRNQSGEMTDKIKDKDSFHGLDSLRYAIALLTGPKETEEVIDTSTEIGPRWH